MKFIHLSDLHLGKRLNEFSLIEDQEYILNKIINIIDDEKPDAVIIAGDIYDKPVPPAEAVRLFDDFLCSLALRRLQVFVISGNHDSAERIAFGSRLMDKSGIHMAPVYDGNAAPVSLEDEYGIVDVYMLPFVKPAGVRRLFKDEQIDSYTDALRACVKNMNVDSSHRNILVTHQFVTGALRSDSEEISIGGADNVDAAVFGDFDYTALGHIHRPQMMGRPAMRYCGTPLKYSVSEWNQEKTLTEIELREKGSQPVITEIPLHPLRSVKVIRGKLEDIIAEAEKVQRKEKNVCQDYVSVMLTDEQDPYQPKERLEALFPQILEVRMDNSRTSHQEWMDEDTDTITDPREVFQRFFLQMQGREMDEEEQQILEEVFMRVEEESR